jgi:hypothetical protein
VSLRNLRITHGRTDGAGAGILNHGNLTLLGSTDVTANETVAGGAAGDGGGVANYGYGGKHPASLTLVDSSAVEGNIAYRNGGGIANRRGTVTMTDSSLVQGNLANRNGGGIFNRGSNAAKSDAERGLVVLTDSAAVQSNLAHDNGGGIYNRGVTEERFYTLYTGDVSLTDSSVVQNNVADSNGGGIANRGAVHMSGGAQVTANQAGSMEVPSFGGGIFNARFVSLFAFEYARPLPSVTGNSAPGGSGGGVYDVPPSGYVRNCTYADAILSPNAPDDPPEVEDGGCD